VIYFKALMNSRFDDSYEIVGIEKQINEHFDSIDD